MTIGYVVQTRLTSDLAVTVRWFWWHRRSLTWDLKSVQNASRSLEQRVFFDAMHILFYIGRFEASGHMALIQRHINVDATSWRCIDVDTTLFQSFVPTGMRLVQIMQVVNGENTLSRIRGRVFDVFPLCCNIAATFLWCRPKANIFFIFFFFFFLCVWILPSCMSERSIT